MKQKFYVYILLSEGKGGYLTHKNRDYWTFKTAVRYADEYVNTHGGVAKVIPVD